MIAIKPMPPFLRVPSVVIGEVVVRTRIDGFREFEVLFAWAGVAQVFATLDADRWMDLFVGRNPYTSAALIWNLRLGQYDWMRN